jgi:transposase
MCSKRSPDERSDIRGCHTIPAYRYAHAGYSLAQALTRIAELERIIGRQQVDLDFFRKALRALKGPAAQGRSAPGLRRSSKP